MIEFIAIEAQNFLSFQSLPKTDLRNLGLVFVKGKNLDDPETDSNDAGKSNLFNLITWVLYEKLAKTGMVVIGDEVINTIAGKDCWATVWLKRDGKDFIITRHRKHKGFRNTAEVTGGITAQGKRAATNDEIVKLLGMTYSMFLASVFWAQGETTRRLTQLTDAEYKALFDEMVGTEDFEMKRKTLGKSVAQIEFEVSTLDMEISRLEGSIQTFEEVLQQDKTRHFDAVELEKLEESYEQYIQAQTDANTHQNTATAKNRDSKTRVEWIKQKNAQLVQITQRLANVDAELEKKKCSQCKQVLKTKEALQEIEDLRKELEDGKVEVANEIKRLESEKSTADAAEKKASADARDATKRINQHWQTCQELLPEGYRDEDGFDCCSVIELIKREREQPEEDPLQKKKLAGMQAKLKELNQEKTKKQTRLDKIEILKRAYGPAGMKSMRLAILNPRLNQKAIEYSQELSGGAIQIRFDNLTETKGGDLRERYSVVVEKDAGVNFRLSGGGMITRANLIAAFALDDVRAEMTGKGVSLKIYDEPSEGLDASGEQAVVDLIRDKLQGTSFFVSHKSLVGENLFDAVWTAVRKDNNSVLVQD